MNMGGLLHLVIVEILVGTVRGGIREYFSSMHNMKALAQCEPVMVPDLESHAKELEEELQVWKSAIRSMKANRRELESGVTHPIDSYLLLKRWKNIGEFVQKRRNKLRKKSTKNMAQKQTNDGEPCADLDKNCDAWAKMGECERNRRFMKTKCPDSCGQCATVVNEDADFKKLLRKCSRTVVSNEDYNGVAFALVRLLRTYSLRTSDLISGRVMGFEALGDLDPSDVLELARAAFHMGEWGIEGQLLAHVIKATSRGGNLALRHEAGVRLATLYAEKKDMRRAKYLMTEVLRDCVDVIPTCAQRQENGLCETDERTRTYTCPNTCGQCKLEYSGEHYNKLILHAPMIKSAKDSGAPPSPLDFERHRKTAADWLVSYERLCRGDVPPPESGYCHLRRTAVPILVFKEEVLSVDPRISMVYDVIGDKEADEVIKRSRNKLDRAQVGTERNSSMARVSMVTWLDDKKPVALKLSRRVELITGLVAVSDTKQKNLMSSDQFQVVNYGLGGHYEPHTDYFPKNDLDLVEKNNTVRTLTETSGDRIATFLYYLTDVQAGGATVFPRINVTVHAKKNAAAFWFNCKMSGEYDPLTMHAGCPVLLGEKWVMNKWIREYGNEFTRKCGLDESYVSESGL